MEEVVVGKKEVMTTETVQFFRQGVDRAFTQRGSIEGVYGAEIAVVRTAAPELNWLYGDIFFLPKMERSTLLISMEQLWLIYRPCKVPRCRSLTTCGQVSSASPITTEST